MDRTDLHKRIIDYYQSSHWLYWLLCYTPKTLSMHHGFWEKTTKNKQEAMLNENQEVIDSTAIHRGQRVLDAGCGIGGTALYIAQKTGAEVWGISLDPKQIRLANQYAQKRNTTSLTHFSTQDYMHTDFPNNYFDVVYGIESVCHAPSKLQFLREAYRILKPGGKIVILDGYASRKPKTTKEHRILADFTWAFALPPMVTNDQMLHTMDQAGFTQIKSINRLKEVLPSIRYFHTWGLATLPFCLLSKYIPIKPIQAIYSNYLAMKSESEGYRIGLADYWEHYGEKP